LNVIFSFLFYVVASSRSWKTNDWIFSSSHSKRLGKRCISSHSILCTCDNFHNFHLHFQTASTSWSSICAEYVECLRNSSFYNSTETETHKRNN
jgi:hypothetical protein